MGCLSILHDSLDDMNKTEIMDLLNTAITSGNHMLNLLNDILDISKNKHLSHELARNKVIFQNLAFEAIDGMKSLAQSKGIRLKSTIVPSTRKDVVVTDRTKVIQIVSNTVNNAIKFTGQEGIDVKFELANTAGDCARLLIEHSFKPYNAKVFMHKEGELKRDENDVMAFVENLKDTETTKWLYFAVSDFGCGMKPTEISDMFLPYKQASSGSNRVFQGTGLGLYICLSLCQQMNGFIGCGSSIGQGTTFSVGIPVEFCPAESFNRQSSRDTSPGPASTASDPEEADASLDIIPMRGPIMIVDDNTVNVKILKRSLEMQFKAMKTAFVIITAPGGREAIDLYKEHKPSLCIVDYHMPEVDGLEVAKTIREYEAEHKLATSKIISYTADATEAAQTVIFQSGADEIMSKPPPKGFIESLASRLRKE